ncbi:MAG: YbhB/YbcL family Raf kinase inhibitor-like protein [Desulfobacterales bacterium CG23_combo_of_CG06-09_8_20_14_all_51_8]|nr:MAG: YbhB/YbcL family Raf kinase inhibitor-like protein [Desulfobacterales bacterium CG23_combo_of_CG06-09_8_20_14_all_51_8]
MKPFYCMFFTVFLLLSLAFANPEKEACEAMELKSPNFENQAEIPRKHTCDGGDISPELRWSGVPNGTRSFALVVDDPDAPDPANPKMTWVHWVLYNIPASFVSLPEGFSKQGLPEGFLNGLNDWKRTGYGGPCPPIGMHRYFHKLYALDVILSDLKNPTQKQLEKAMDGHILKKAELVGLYHR